MGWCCACWPSGPPDHRTAVSTTVCPGRSDGWTRCVVDGLWQEYRPRNAHDSRRRGGPAPGPCRTCQLSMPPGGRAVGHPRAQRLGQDHRPCSRPWPGSSSRALRVHGRRDLGAGQPSTAGVSRDLSGQENLLIGEVPAGHVAAARCGPSTPRRHRRVQRLDRRRNWANPQRAYSAGMGLRIGFLLVVHSDRRGAARGRGVGRRRRGVPANLSGPDRGPAGPTECVIVVASHDLTLVERFCDRVVVLSEGSVAFDGPAGSGVAHPPDHPPSRAAPPSGASDRMTRADPLPIPRSRPVPFDVPSTDPWKAPGTPAARPSRFRWHTSRRCRPPR